jgi:hypothetical protein
MCGLLKDGGLVCPTAAAAATAAVPHHATAKEYELLVPKAATGFWL